MKTITTFADIKKVTLTPQLDTLFNDRFDRECEDGSIKILHFDDDPYCLEFTKLFLEEINPCIYVISASSWETSSYSIDDQFSCVLCDYNMPVTDGLEITRKIKQVQDVPIIMYTWWDNDQFISEAMVSGIDKLVYKEVNPEHYVNLAREIKTTILKHKPVK